MKFLHLLPLFSLVSACNGDPDTADTAGAEDCMDCDTSADSGQSQSWTGPAVIINEFMADNATTIQAPSGEYTDWIELHNLTNERIDLSGWTITDDLDDPEMFRIVGVTIDPMGFKLLWADDTTNPGHVAFKLGKDGEEIGLYDSDGNAHTRLTYEAQATDWSAARIPDGSPNWEIIDNATPGLSNIGP